MRPGFAWLIRRVLDFMIEFIGSLCNWLQQFTNHWDTVIFRLDTRLTSNWAVSLLLASHYMDSGRTTAQKTHPSPSNGYMRTHIENTSYDTGSIVACITGVAWKWVYSIVGCVFVAGLFTEAFPSNGSTCHNIKHGRYISYLLIIL
jgi:hypothetical protein